MTMWDVSVFALKKLAQITQMCIFRRLRQKNGKSGMVLHFCFAFYVSSTKYLKLADTLIHLFCCSFFYLYKIFTRKQLQNNTTVSIELHSNPLAITRNKSNMSKWIIHLLHNSTTREGGHLKFCCSFPNCFSILLLGIKYSQPLEYMKGKILVWQLNTRENLGLYWFKQKLKASSKG